MEGATGVRHGRGGGLGFTRLGVGDASPCPCEAKGERRRGRGALEAANRGRGALHCASGERPKSPAILAWEVEVVAWESERQGSATRDL